ncbi:DUF3575 domain-containing protein [Hymenobacter sp. IS2118]|uniref:DUF3575 domain-containing protein n=1 Tax=Hymenobacter sp. IS2118 TaxID=1505605 RepID=UPI001377EF3D|nr:DUF3575 domain-containing protein [Hymenobacter sp. IS2118]
MITKTVCCAAVFCLAALGAVGQGATSSAPTEAPKNIIKIAPLAFVHGQLPFTVESRLGYERAIGERGSLMGSYSYLGTNYPFSFLGSVALSSAISTAFTAAGHPAIVWTETRIRTTGHRYQFQYRYYLSQQRRGLQGLYLAPHFSYAQAEYNISLKDFDVTRILKTTNRNYNLLFGYQRIVWRHLAAEAFTGLGYRDIQTKSYDENGAFLENMPNGSALKISSGFNLGWAF